MCGIAGLTGSKNFFRLRRLLGLISHRGRDETRTWWSGGVNLGINRLAVNDLRQGLYPMKYKRYVLVYNGEIYNYQELKKHLVERGVRLFSDCDGEVILPLFDLYGAAAFKKLEGMFAVAIVDLNKPNLILARDKLGEKPLYYFDVGGSLVFASEMKAILKEGRHTWGINRDSLAEYLQQGFAFGPKTIVKGIKKLLPGQVLEYDLKTKQISRHRYWQPKLVGQPQQTEEELIETLENELNRSVRQRLLADVPLGCFVSGGVDSALVAFFAGKHRAKLKTFSVGFPDETEHDESNYSRQVAEMLATDHQEIDCTQQSCLPVAENIGKIIDEPISDPAALPTFLLSKLASRWVKVVLTGDGGDEVFGGYDRYRKQLLAEKFKAFGWFPPLHKRYSTQGIWLQTELIKFPAVLKRWETQNPLAAMQLSDLAGFLPEQLMMKVDKMSMQHTLESRAPFLDSKLVQLGINLPTKLKIRRWHGKYLLKKLAERYIPKPLVWRPKHSFTLPIGSWLRREWRELAKESLESLKNDSELFHKPTYERVVKQHLSGECEFADKIWSMIVLSRWADEYKIRL